MTTILIEDEPLMARHLAKLIEAADPTLEILTTLDSIEAGVQYFERGGARPDLFFSDISLADGLSFELLRRIQNTRPVIFCTAHDEYALDAFRTYGIDYLLKPFEATDVAQALEKYRRLTGQDQPPVDFGAVQQFFAKRLHEQRGMEVTFLVHRGERIIPISAANAALFVVRDGITYLHSFRNEQFALDGTLEAAEQRLGSDFFRLNRQTLVHRKAVAYVERYFARKLLVKTTVPVAEQLIVSKANAGRFLTWLGR